MEPIQIKPLNGENFEQILTLICSKKGEPAYDIAWQNVEKAVKHFSEKAPLLDFNQIFVEVITLEILTYPIVKKDAQKPLKSSESQEIIESMQWKLKQLKSLQQTLKELKQQESPLTEPLQLLFDALKSIYQKMHSSWAEYNTAWKAFRVQPENETSEAKKTIPCFNQVGWQVMQLCFRALWAEVEYRKEWKQGVCHQEEVADYPLFPLLIQEIQALHSSTQGFELLEQIQLAQKRNQQLAKQLQFLYGTTPILPPIKKTAPESSESSNEPKQKKHSVSRFKNNKKNKSWWVLLGMGVFGGIFLILMVQPLFVEKKLTSFQPQLPKQQGSSQKKSLSFFVDSSRPFPQSTAKMMQYVQSQGLEIPVYAPHENLKQLFQTQAITQETLQAMTTNNEAFTAIFVDDEEAHFISGENSHSFDSVEALQNFLKAAAETYQQAIQVAQTLQKELSQYQISILLPETPNGEYGIVLRNQEKQIVGRIGMEADGFKLQWKDATGNFMANTAQDLVKAIKTLEPPQ